MISIRITHVMNKFEHGLKCELQLQRPTVGYTPLDKKINEDIRRERQIFNLHINRRQWIEYLK